MCTPPCLAPSLAAEALLSDVELGKAQVPLSTLDLAPGAINDLWLPMVSPATRHARLLARHKRQEQQKAAARPPVGSSYLPTASAAATQDSARGSGGCLAGRHSQPDAGASAAAAAGESPSSSGSFPLLQRATSLTGTAAAAALGGMGLGGGGGECRLHVQATYHPFDQYEAEAARSAGRPQGMVPILRRLSR